MMAKKKWFRFNIEFDSKIEMECYTVLKSEGYTFDYQPVYDILPSIKKDVHLPLISTAGMRAKKVTPDFEIHLPLIDIILDTKGFHSSFKIVNGKKKWTKHKYTDHIKYKYEMLRRYFYEQGMFDKKIFIIDEAHIAQFYKDLNNFKNGKINFTEIINQY